MTEAGPGGRPLPPLDADSRPFWESCRRHAMALQRCVPCGAFRFPPRGRCPRCLSDAAHWVPVAGTGRVYASLVVSQALGEAWKDHVPFNLSLVELDEGPRMWSNITGCDPDEVRIGDRVRVVYEEVAPKVVLPRFHRVP